MGQVWLLEFGWRIPHHVRVGVSRLWP